MNKKKNKWSFVDLDDKDFETISNQMEADEKKEVEKQDNDLNFKLTLNDLKTKDDWKENTTNVSEEDFEPLKKIENKNNRKINYEVNYDDILDNDNRKIVNELFSEEKPKQPNLFINENGEKEYRNLKPRGTLKTYNEALKRQENNINENHTFGENKIKQFLTVKEKLDVKTNIYLKSSIVIKLRELEERTNESRSSIINKLIEIALKTIEEEKQDA